MGIRIELSPFFIYLNDNFDIYLFLSFDVSYGTSTRYCTVADGLAYLHQTANAVTASKQSVYRRHHIFVGYDKALLADSAYFASKHVGGCLTQSNE